jgi:hypothetical protein
MQGISATVNQDPTQPIDGSSDFNLWMAFLNRAQAEYVQAYDWEELRKLYWPTFSGLTNATIPMPSDYRKISAPVLNYSFGIQDGQPWEEVPADHLQFKNPESDFFFYTFGDPANGYFLQWYPATIASGTSLSIPYYSVPTSLASATQELGMIDPEFLTQRVIAYVFESRSDPRYQDEENKARERLLNMVENSSVSKFNSYVNPIRIMTSEQRRSFRLGRN